MKATQDNAVWISNSYQQGSTEDNWAKLGARYRVSKQPLVIQDASTTQATVHTPYDTPSSSATYVLYNSTDGEVTKTVTVVNNAATTLSSDSFTAINTTTQGTYYGTKTDACAGIFVPDGSVAYLKGATGGQWYKIGLPVNFQLDNTNNTLDNTITLTTAAADQNTRTQMASYAAGGNYVYLWGKGKTIARYSLSTPYLLETNSDLQTYDLNSLIFSSAMASGYNDTAPGFCGFKVSADGTKGMAALRRWGSTDGNERLNYLFIGFSLSTPFDLSTLSVTSTGNAFSSTSSTYFTNAVTFSESGDHVEGTSGQYNNNQYYNAGYFSTPWDVSSYSSVTSEYLNNWHQGSMIYNNNYQFCFMWNPDQDKVYSPTYNEDRFDTSGSGFATTGTPFPNSVLSYSSSGLTTAPTAIFKDGVQIDTISYGVLTRAQANQDGLSLAIDKDSTGTSLSVFTPMDYQGSSALNNTGLSIDGTSFTTGTPTHANDDLSVGSNTSAMNTATKGNQLENNCKYIGLFTYDDISARSGASPSSWSAPMGMAFSNDGKKFLVSGYSGAPNFSSLGGTTTDNPVVVWDLSTAWDVGTKSFNSAVNLNTLLGAPSEPSINYYGQDFAFNADGTKMYVLHSYSTGGLGYLYEGNLSSPYDPSTWSYETHISLSGSTGLIDEDYIYSFALAPDGKAIKLFMSNTTGNISSTTYTKSWRVKLATPFSLNSATNGTIWSNYNDYRGSLWGDETYGYTGISTETADTGHRYNLLRVTCASGNFSDKTQSSDDFDLSLGVEDWVDSSIGSSSTRTGKIVVTDGGTKMYIHFPQLHAVAMFTGPFGNFQDKYTFDISSLSLSDQPRSVNFSISPTFTSMGSTSLSSSTNLYKEYETAEVSINAEALKFKIEGDNNSEVTRFNADLFT